MKAFAVAALALGVCACAGAPRLAAPAVTVPALRETAPVDARGDAADDPAIWVAADVADSVVIGTQKQGGLFVYDLGGAIVQSLPGGRPNNVDLRGNFPWPEGRAPIVAASDRSDNSMVIWRFDETTRRLEEQPRARIVTPFRDVYGICLGRRGDAFIAIVTSTVGDVGLWVLSPDAEGGVTGDLEAQFAFGPPGDQSIAEGCVIDDAHGAAFIGQEMLGVWRAAIADVSDRALIDRIGDGRLVADVEGLAIWDRGDGTGYLIASVQGANRFAVYDRMAPHAYRGAFEIGASRDGSTDAVGETDGIDVVSASLGADLPQGLFVAQDGANTHPAAMQNFKYVSVAEIFAALGLD
ncbi:MAG: phytase [Alphaproteobacteria bacterium]|nr:phytase [Alphaproteobacteria bacterium]